VDLIGKNIFLWLVLIVVALLGNSAYVINSRFCFADLTIIAVVALLIREKVYTAYIFGIAAALVHDAFLMPFQGFSLVSVFTAMLTASALCMSLFRENYFSRVIILAAAVLVQELTRGVLVFVYYNAMKKFEFPPAVLLKAVMTVALGAVVFKILEIDYGRLVSWLTPGKIFRKR
jgi:hypothetical protein